MYQGLLESAADTALEPFAPQLAALALQIWETKPHGDLKRWQQAIDTLPEIDPDGVDINSAVVTASADSVSADQHSAIREGLQVLHPWRKGPFNIHGIPIDSEWRSDLKWQRLQGRLAPLSGRLILDVGCGNGYYGWRMLGSGARLVLGIDPTQLFVKQFEAIRHFLGSNQYAHYLLPLGVEQLPAAMAVFDTVFSMGVFYHRRSPFEHLSELRNCLRQGGELVLETLVIDGPEGQVLVPGERYAKMRNVWFLPAPATLLQWLKRAGFRNARVLDITPTTVDEQRSTDWMRFESLADFLDPADPGHTIEGYPAPVRAIFLAEK